ncbi:YSIRK-type signal peptide-containing protein, partial [Streptococcus oralis]|uniref:YSIRK-type signal peptide-containing protein n=2 Tax=Streptococcus TaxID=1301 RepID=UPI0020C8C97F
MNRRQRFSLRKYKFGLASVLLGTALVFGASQVSANEQSTGENQAQTQEIKTELKDDKHSNSTTDLTTTNGIAPVVGEKQEAETSKEDASKQDAKVETPVDKTAESQESGKD